MGSVASLSDIDESTAKAAPGVASLDDIQEATSAPVVAAARHVAAQAAPNQGDIDQKNWLYNRVITDPDTRKEVFGGWTPGQKPAAGQAETPQQMPDRVVPVVPRTQLQSDQDIAQITNVAPKALRDFPLEVTPGQPMTTAERLVAEQQEQRGGAALAIQHKDQPPDQLLKAAKPTEFGIAPTPKPAPFNQNEAVEVVPRPRNVSLSGPSKPAPQPMEEAAGGTFTHPSSLEEQMATNIGAHPEQVGQLAKQPLLPIGDVVREQVAKVPDDPSRWFLNSIMDAGIVSGDTIQRLSTPANAAILGTLALAPQLGVPALAMRLVNLGFSEEMARSSAEGIVNGYKALQNGEYREAGRQWADAGATFLLALQGAKQSLDIRTNARTYRANENGVDVPAEARGVSALGGAVQAGKVETPTGTRYGVKIGNTTFQTNGPSRAVQISEQAAPPVAPNPEAITPRPTGPQPVTEQHIAPVVAKIVTLPPEQQGPAIIQAHREITQAIVKGGAIVDGKITPPGQPKAAEKTATRIAEDAIAVARQPTVPVARPVATRVPTVATRQPVNATASPQAQTPQEAPKAAQPTPSESLGKAATVEVTENFPVTKQAAASLTRAGANQELQKQFARTGITGISVEAPYKFELSEQANIDRSGKILLNADAENAEHTLAHEVAHDIYNRMYPGEQEAVRNYITTNGIEKQHAGGIEERIADHFADVIAGKVTAPDPIRRIFLEGKLRDRAAHAEQAPQLEAPRRAPRTLDEIRKESFGNLVDTDNIPDLIAKNGDFPVSVKDVNGWRHVMPASVFDKLTKTPADGFIREVSLAQPGATTKIDPQGQRQFVEIANRLSKELPAKGGEPSPELIKRAQSNNITAEELKAHLELAGYLSPAKKAELEGVRVGERETRQGERQGAGKEEVIPGGFKKGEFVYHEGRRVQVDGGVSLSMRPIWPPNAPATKNEIVDIRTQEGHILHVNAATLSREPQEKLAPTVTPQVEPKRKEKPTEPEKAAQEVENKSKLETEAPREQPENQPARTTGKTENLPRVPEPSREGGNASGSISAEGNRPTPQAGETQRSAGSEDRDRLERPAGREGERGEPARSGGTGAAEHPVAEREARGAGEARPTGADGRPVESPTPETPEKAKATAAELRNQRNFRISDEYAAAIGKGGEITKIKGNLDALETLKKLQAEGREVATPEEQQTIAKYVDFGGLVGMLENHWKPQYVEHYRRFNDLLTSDEIKEIRETLPNTHYTSLKMVDWMWAAMERMGFKGGRILEPGMGIGNFLGRIPEKIAGKSELYGVERNPLTGAMAKYLYPDASIVVKPFQQFTIPDNTLDAVIGNVPFQDFDVTDDPRYSKLKLNLHNYFIVKSLDKLRPGGIMAVITSRYTMDGTTGKLQRAREEMAKRADLIAAIRLPDSAFKGNANTDVVADLLVFQKRDPNATLEKMPDWTTTAPVTVPGQKPIVKNAYGREYIENESKTHPKEFMLNKYWADNPANVLGEHSQAGTMYGPGQYTVKAPADFEKALEGATELIPQKIVGKAKAAEVKQSETPSTELRFAPDEVKPGSFYKDERGNILIKEAGVGVELSKELRTFEKMRQIRNAIDLRDQLNRVIKTQLETSDDAPIKEEQKKLAALYDVYHKNFGSLHGPKLKAVFGDDPEYPKLLALENLDTETKEISKASIFTKRVLAPYEPLRDLPDDPKASMLKVMAERGYLDTKLMADLLKQPEQDVIDKLEKQSLIFQDPQSGKYHTADEYLSGNVREKLELAKHAADTDPKYKSNVEALEKAQPKPLTIHDIQPSLGQTWIPMDIYKGFVRHLAGQGIRDLEISRDATGRWLVQIPSGGVPFDLSNKWAGGGIAGHKLIQYALNQQQPTVWNNHSDGTREMDGPATTAARDKLAAIKEEFRTVLRRARPEVVENLEKIYNDTFNAHKLREFSGEHLDFPGMSEEWRGLIRGYQKAAVWRTLQEGRAGIFHAPGLGKTLTMAATGMEARRLKLSRKNMYAVPNHMVPQWREDFKRFYPNANVLAVSDEDFTATNRAKLMSRIATGDWDAVIVPHSQFDLLPMSPEWEKKTIDKRLADYREVLEDLDEKDDRKTIKQIEKAIDKLESRLNELNSKKKDNAIPFDQLGVDMLFVDEAHAYKAMAVPSRMGNIGGISNRASQRAFALEMKADYLRETHKGRGLVFGTGTPITNTVGELYVMTKYLAPEMLEAAGIRSFDDWAANFATTVTQWEYAADGVTFKPKTTLSEFINVPELSTIFQRYAEYLSKDAARKLSNLKLPEVDRKDHMVKITPVQEPLLEMIADRGEHLTKNPPRTKEERQADNWLKLSSDARKISLDPRLYEPMYHDDPNSKANAAVKVIKDTLDASKDKKGTVAVFSDFFQHKGTDGKPDFNLFEDMRKKLVKQGIPRDQIAIIHEADTKELKEELFSKVRNGRVRVIFGSTEKMGIGTNIQDRLKAELHLDQP